MIMMTNKQFPIRNIMRLLVVIPLLAALIITIPSCSGSRKASKAKTEALPPPPPPPPPSAPGIVPEDVFTVVEEMPVFPGGDEALKDFIIKNVVYPKEAKDKNIQGRVVIRFVVAADGSVGQIVILRKVDPLLDAEAVRVVKMLPKFKPGMQGGKPVNVYYTMPVTFGLMADPFSNRPRYMVFDGDTIYLMLKENPQFPGGREAFEKFKADNLKYPADAKNNGFEGYVSVSFLVGKDGSLTDFTITGGVSPSLDAEALRVAKMMPAWLPGKENGRPVKVKYSAGFNFTANPSPEVPKEVFVVVEEMPLFPGGDSALMSFITKNINYPKIAKENAITGRVVLKFCINYLGNVEQVGILKTVDPSLDAEAIRVIKLLPPFKPGKQGGKPVNVWYNVPVVFALDGAPKPSNVPPPPPPPPPAPQSPQLFYGYDEPPQFQGGEAALARFIESQKKYPQEALQNKISGTVMIGFTITETGNTDKILIRSSVDPLLDAEAMRVIMFMPDWKPGKLKGKPVSVTYVVPVRFKL
jgi:TonB family protein